MDESQKKEAEERARMLAETFAPTIARMNAELTQSLLALQKTLGPNLEVLKGIELPIAKSIAATMHIRESMLEEQKRLAQWAESFAPKEEVLLSSRRETIIYARNDTVRIDDKQFELLLEKLTERIAAEPSNSTTDLTFDRTEKILFRMANGTRLVSRFAIGENKKRLNLFEKLLRSKKYVDTAELAELLGCEPKSVRAVANRINAKVSKDLDIKGRIIEGRSNMGYRISVALSIHQI